MPHFLSRAEANALHYLALALRTDWEHNRPGPTWQKELGNTWPTLPHADDFRHALRALVLFADRKADDSTHIMRTPNPYAAAGRHWEETRKTDSGAKPPPCEDHPDYGTTRFCKACKSEIAAGHRPHDKHGQHYEPPLEEPHPGVAQTPHSHHEPLCAHRRTPANTAGTDKTGVPVDWGGEPE